jgi:hypothetical protein
MPPSDCGTSHRRARTPGPWSSSHIAEASHGSPSCGSLACLLCIHLARSRREPRGRRIRAIPPPSEWPTISTWSKLRPFDPADHCPRVPSEPFGTQLAPGAEPRPQTHHSFSYSSHGNPRGKFRTRAHARSPTPAYSTRRESRPRSGRTRPLRRFPFGAALRSRLAVASMCSAASIRARSKSFELGLLRRCKNGIAGWASMMVKRSMDRYQAEARERPGLRRSRIGRWRTRSDWRDRGPRRARLGPRTESPHRCTDYTTPRRGRPQRCPSGHAACFQRRQ